MSSIKWNYLKNWIFKQQLIGDRFDWSGQIRCFRFLGENNKNLYNILVKYFLQNNYLKATCFFYRINCIIRNYFENWIFKQQLIGDRFDWSGQIRCFRFLGENNQNPYNIPVKYILQNNYFKATCFLYLMNCINRNYLENCNFKQRFLKSALWALESDSWKKWSCVAKLPKSVSECVKHCRTSVNQINTHEP